METRVAKDDDMTEPITGSECPVNYSIISKHQFRDPEILRRLAKNKFSTKSLNKTLVVYDKNNRMPIPSSLRQDIITWYHTNLCHPGIDRTEQSIRQNFTWKNMRKDIRHHVETCDKCQRLKRHTEKYGELPAKIAEFKP